MVRFTLFLCRNSIYLVLNAGFGNVIGLNCRSLWHLWGFFRIPNQNIQELIYVFILFLLITLSDRFSLLKVFVIFVFQIFSFRWWSFLKVIILVFILRRQLRIVIQLIHRIRVCIINDDLLILLNLLGLSIRCWQKIRSIYLKQRGIIFVILGQIWVLIFKVGVQSFFILIQFKVVGFWSFPLTVLGYLNEFSNIQFSIWSHNFLLSIRLWYEVLKSILVLF